MNNIKTNNSPLGDDEEDYINFYDKIPNLFRLTTDLSENHCKREIDCVSGPHYISYHTSRKFNRKVYIFGEYHNSLGNIDCTNYEYGSKIPFIFAEMIACNRDKKIDFYIENAHFTENFEQEQNRWYRPIIDLDYIPYHLNGTRHLFFFSNIPENVHYHSMDRRFSYDSDDFVRNYDTLCEKKTNNLAKLKNYHDDKFNEVFKNFEMYDFLYKKQKKQISKNHDEKFIKLYNQFISNFYQELKDYTNQANYEYENGLMSYDDMLIVYRYISDKFGVFLVDIYTIGRMSKNYSDGFNENIIIHCGYNHAINYRDFFKLLDFDEIVSEIKTPEPDEQSVDVSNFDILSFNFISERHSKRRRRRSKKKSNRRKTGRRR